MPQGSPSERAARLIASATSANLRRARRLLAADPALARHDLACACATGEADEVSRALAADPSAVSEPTGPYAWQPISYACFSRLLRRDPERGPGIREVVRRLLAAGADPNAAFIHDERWLQVPLYGAAGINGDTELTRMLLDAGADPTDEREGYAGNEVLYHACEHRDPTCARLVIDAGARQDLVDYDLGRALNFPNHEMIEMFCTHGAKPRAAHLHQAVWRRRPPPTIAALLDAGAPLDEPDEHGLAPLRIAVRWGERDTAQLLRDRGAAETAVTGEDRALGAYLSGEGAAPPTSPSLSQALLDEMVISAVQGGYFETMCRLLDAGARVDGDPDSDDDPLGQACWRSRVEIARELVRRGAALTFPGEGSAIGAALHGSRHCQDPEGGPTMQTIDEIAKEPYAEIVKLLIAAGATVPERMGPGGRPTARLLAALGIAPPTSNPREGGRVMTEMNAAVVTSFEHPPRYQRFPIPEPTSDDEIVVDVLAAGLHPRVRTGAAGAHYTSSGTLPMIPGIDAVAVRADGKRIYFASDDDTLGTMAEKALADPRRSIELPDGVAAEDVAAAMNPAMSSWVALRRRVPLEPGQSVLILGATGNAGAMAVQVAKLLGAGRVVGAGRDLTRLRALSSIGADDIVQLTGDAEATAAALAAAAAEVDIVVDYLWGAPAQHAIVALLTARSDRSRALDWIQIGAITGPTIELPSVALRSANLRIQGSGQGSVSPAAYRAELPSLVEEIGAGTIAVNAATIPLADVEAAWTRPEAPGERIVLIP